MGLFAIFCFLTTFSLSYVRLSLLFSTLILCLTHKLCPIRSVFRIIMLLIGHALTFD